MFKLDHKSIIIGSSALIASAMLFSGCVDSTIGKYEIENKTAIDGGVTYKRTPTQYAGYARNPQSTDGVNFGRPATANEIKAWDLDALPSGEGLPEGEGSVEDGDELYEAQCASCHGDFGGGGNGYPQLAGGNMSKDKNGIVITLKNQRLAPGDDAPKRTVGTYWPYATTLFTYTRDAMPYATPKSLSNNEVYAITAYILAQNEIMIDGVEMDDEYVLNAEKLARVVLPNRDGFYPNIDGPTGPADVKAFFADRAKNIGSGTRCMTDCKDPGMDGKTEATVMKIGYEMSDVSPAYSTVRDLPPEVDNGLVTKAEKMYNASCKLCHKTDRMGAPAVGDSAIWDELIAANGVNGIVKNAIVGSGGMPPRGGNMDLTDNDMKSIVEFMIDSSKKH